VSGLIGLPKSPPEIDEHRHFEEARDEFWEDELDTEDVICSCPCGCLANLGQMAFRDERCGMCQETCLDRL